MPLVHICQIIINPSPTRLKPHITIQYSHTSALGISYHVDDLSMPICIECRYPVPQLYHVLHSSNNRGTSNNPSTKTAENGIQISSAGGPKVKATGGATGGDVRLTQCPRCKRFADKYVEHDFVVLFIDLVLVKPQVSNH